MKNVTDMSKAETAINNKNLVIINEKDYNKKMMEEDIERHLLRAEDDIRNGRVRDAREIFTKWKEKYGL